MKQHITEEQFNEVDGEKLKKHFKEQGWHWDDITIGRMIEFLLDYGRDNYIDHKRRHGVIVPEIIGIDFCDELW